VEIGTNLIFHEHGKSKSWRSAYCPSCWRLIDGCSGCRQPERINSDSQALQVFCGGDNRIAQ
jgi:hypothetical protein